MSKGIFKRDAQINLCLDGHLRYYKFNSVLHSDDIFVGWGQKANTRQIKQRAHALGLPYWQLEDGFIGYVGHPAKGGLALSLIADPVGIYYDARQPSQLEQLIATPCDSALLARAERLMADLVRFGITKYNCYASSEAHQAGSGDLLSRLQADPRPRVLLVDQVAGDLSIPGALASEADFLAMVAAARRAHPTARLLLRTHPDTRFSHRWRRRKRGVLARLAARDPALADLEVISEPCHPHALIGLVSAVYTVSSQLGFEALLLGKPVHCFGMPFYAGWGLTHDSQRCERRAQAVTALAAAGQGISLPQLVAAALICYPRYLDP
ncbi:beta-3-deoxy-D-manno-oct-2-ulosonic acid transferase, partial [Aeromonas cavernicola]